MSSFPVIDGKEGFRIDHHMFIRSLLYPHLLRPSIECRSAWPVVLESLADRYLGSFGRCRIIQEGSNRRSIRCDPSPTLATIILGFGVQIRVFKDGHDGRHSVLSDGEC